MEKESVMRCASHFLSSCLPEDLDLWISMEDGELDEVCLSFSVFLSASSLWTNAGFRIVLLGVCRLGGGGGILCWVTFLCELGKWQCEGLSFVLSIT